uniref:Putative ovule protein n=1 Tax=Solanum chacoense TaxID=4108 RepID=A0A0V0H846_SOLCH
MMQPNVGNYFRFALIFICLLNWFIHRVTFLTRPWKYMQQELMRLVKWKHFFGLLLSIYIWLSFKDVPVINKVEESYSAVG